VFSVISCLVGFSFRRRATRIGLGSRTFDLGKACERFEDRQSVDGAVPFALLKISVNEAHRIGNMRDTENRFVAFARKGIESGSLHFDG
jgi:hypothetical protein